MLCERRKRNSCFLVEPLSRFKQSEISGSDEIAEEYASWKSPLKIAGDMLHQTLVLFDQFVRRRPALTLRSLSFALRYIMGHT
jgi:hypothetical protein